MTSFSSSRDLSLHLWSLKNILGGTDLQPTCTTLIEEWTCVYLIACYWLGFGAFIYTLDFWWVAFGAGCSTVLVPIEYCGLKAFLG